MYLYNMRNILLTIFTALLIMGCTTNNNTYNCTCECKCDMGTCMVPPSDTLCVKADVDSVTVETEIKEGEQ